jgi:hypothetical protein
MNDTEEMIYCYSDTFDDYSGIALFRMHIPSEYAPILQAFNVMNDIDQIMSFIVELNRNNNTSFDLVGCYEVFDRAQDILNNKFGAFQYLFELENENKVIFVSKFEEFGDEILATLRIRK